MSSYSFQKATKLEVLPIAQLYDDLNDYLEAHTNYPNWKKGVYPTCDTAQTAFEQGTLFTFKQGDAIVASVILNHLPEEAYHTANWGIELSYEDIFVIHTFVVHPQYLHCGVGIRLMDAIYEHALAQGIKAIRLDVSIHNQPAIALYQKSGYCYIDTVDLGLDIIELRWFKLYQLLL